MGRVLAVSSQTVYGPVGLSAAVPVLESAGHVALALPTVMLSHHPGHGKPSGQATPAALLHAMWGDLEKVGALQQLDAVLTGYFASADQVIAVVERLQRLITQTPRLHILVDPVIGDHGKLYVAEAVAQAIRDHLLPLATMTTPNIFELEWLSKQVSIPQAVKALGVRETLVTSVPQANNQIANLLFTEGSVHEDQSPRLAHVPHGTGDYLAAAYLAERLFHAPLEAFHAAMTRLHEVIARSTGSPVLKPNPA
jgi:pyridoxine kinase